MTDPDDVRYGTAEHVANLIELGRDREAAALGAASGRQHDQIKDDAEARTGGGHMEVLAQLDQLGPELGKVVDGITADQLDNPTPCSKFTVQGVLEHMVGGATMFAAVFRGQAPPTGDLPDDLLASFGPAITDLFAAINEPGALDRTIQAPFGAVPGITFARYVVVDGLTHGWDLSIASGQSYTPPDELVAEADTFARGLIDDLRDGDTFAAAVDPPENATPIERLVAFTGRQVTGGTR